MLDSKQGSRVHSTGVKGRKRSEWAETTVLIAKLPEDFSGASQIQFILPPGSKLLLDDVLHY